MNSLVIHITTLFFLYLLTIVQLVRHKDRLPQMTSMMITMSLAMVTGILAGYLPAIFFKGDLFTFTIIGTLLGSGLGMLSGLFFGMLNGMEGFFTGLMSGMMGAMIAVMLPVNRQLPLMNFFSILFIVTLSLVAYLLVQQLSEQKTPSILRLIAHPLYPMLLSSMLWLILPNQTIQSNPTLKSVVISTNEYTYIPSTIEIRVNQPLQILLLNPGTQEHDLEIDNIKTADVQNNGHTHNHSGKSDTIHLHVKPGENSSITFTPKKAGIYRWHCTLPGHTEAGMIGNLTVQS